MKRYVDNKELKMKEIINKYIKKPLCYSAISALLLTETSIASVYELTDANGKKVTLRKAGDEGKHEFEILVNQFSDGKLTGEYKAGKRVGVKGEQSGTVEDKHQEKYTPIGLTRDEQGFYEFDSQMLGAAVFFPKSTSQIERQQVYVAKKIIYKGKGQYTASDVTKGYASETNAAQIADSFKNKTDVDHTERQLVAAILTEKGLGSNSEGTMRIYTKGHPCVDDSAADAGEISCVNYYKKLAKVYPNIKFHVYFSKNNDISEEDIRAIRKQAVEKNISVPEHDLYNYKYLLTQKLVNSSRQQNSAFCENFKCDSEYLVYLLKYLNRHGMGTNYEIVQLEKGSYKINISYTGKCSLMFSKIQANENIACTGKLNEVVDKITGRLITAPDRTTLRREDLPLIPIIPIDDFNLAYNGGKEITKEDNNNLEFKLLKPGL